MCSSISLYITISRSFSPRSADGFAAMHVLYFLYRMSDWKACQKRQEPLKNTQKSFSFQVIQSSRLLNWNKIKDCRILPVFTFAAASILLCLYIKHKLYIVGGGLNLHIFCRCCCSSCSQFVCFFFFYFFALVVPSCLYLWICAWVVYFCLA